MSQRLQAGFLATVVICMPGCQTHTDGVVPGTTYNAGEIIFDREKNIEHTFKVRTNSSRPVKILKESHGCVCTTVKLSSNTIAPGGSADLTVVVTTTNSYSRINAACELTTDSADTPTLNYTITGTCYPDARVNADRIILGRDADGKGYTSDGLWLEVFRGAREPPPKEIKITPPADVELRASTPPQAVRYGDSTTCYRYALRCHVASEKVGLYVRSASIVVDGKSFLSPLIQWEKPSPLKLIPSAVHFEITEGVKPGSKRVMIKGPFNASFRVMGAFTAGDSAVVARFNPKLRGTIHTLEIEASGAPPVGTTITGIMNIITDIDNGSALELPWSVRVKGVVPRDGPRANPRESLP